MTQQMTRHQQLPLLMLFTVLTLLVLMSSTAHAGTGGEYFDDVWATIKDWTEGTLGRIIAGAMILVGIIGGVARQSLMAFAMGISGGMGLSYSPQIIEGIMSATLSSAAAVTSSAHQISNGLGI